MNFRLATFVFFKIFRISIEAMQGNGGLDNALVMIFVIFAREAQRAVDQDGNLWMLLRMNSGFSWGTLIGIRKSLKINHHRFVYRNQIGTRKNPKSPKIKISSRLVCIILRDEVLEFIANVVAQGDRYVNKHLG